jgi:hypothetical protein
MAFKTETKPEEATSHAKAQAQQENAFMQKMAPLSALVEIPRNLGLETNENATRQTLLAMAEKNRERLGSFLKFISIA